jgi:hypothetical protein
MPGQANWPTLAESLRAADVPLPADTAGTERIASSATLDDARWYVIGYYDPRQDGGGPLTVRVFDKRRRSWRLGTHEGIGGLVSVTRSGRLFYLEGHASPSAAPTLVLDEQLTARRTLAGWPVRFLADGRVIFKRNMIHFSPAQAQVLAIYDPDSDREATFYPVDRDNERGIEDVPGTDLMMDRTIGEIALRRNGAAIEFPVVEQPRRVTRENRGEPEGPRVSFRVACDLSPRVPACRRVGATPPPSRAPARR